MNETISQYKRRRILNNNLIKETIFLTMIKDCIWAHAWVQYRTELEFGFVQHSVLYTHLQTLHYATVYTIHNMHSTLRQSHYTMKSWIHSNHLHRRDNLVIRYALGVKAEPCQHAEHMTHEDLLNPHERDNLLNTSSRRYCSYSLGSTSTSVACGAWWKVA